MQKLLVTTAVLVAISGAAFAGAHVQVPDAANDATMGTGGEGAPANAANAGLGDPGSNNSGGKNSTGAQNASQKGSDRGQGKP